MAIFLTFLTISYSYIVSFVFFLFLPGFLFIFRGYVYFVFLIYVLMF